jgi:hypothetical protein
VFTWAYTKGISYRETYIGQGWGLFWSDRREGLAGKQDGKAVGYEKSLDRGHNPAADIIDQPGLAQMP